MHFYNILTVGRKLSHIHIISIIKLFNLPPSLPSKINLWPLIQMPEEKIYETSK